MEEANSGGNPYQCAQCGAAIPANGRSPNCSKCGAKLPLGIGLTTRTDAAAPAPVAAGNGSATACILLGVVALAVGLYFLLNPSADGYRDVANLHALAMGQAFTIAGTILLGFGIRPR